MNIVAVVIVILIISIHSQSVRALIPARGLTSLEVRAHQMPGNCGVPGSLRKKTEVSSHQLAILWSFGLPGSLRTSKLSSHQIAILSGGHLRSHSGSMRSSDYFRASQVVAVVLRYEDDGPRAVKRVFAVTLVMCLASGSHGSCLAALNGNASSWRSSSNARLVDTSRRSHRPTLRRADLRLLVNSLCFFLVWLLVRPFACGACAVVGSNQRVGRSPLGWCTCVWRAVLRRGGSDRDTFPLLSLTCS